MSVGIADPSMANRASAQAMSTLSQAEMLSTRIYQDAVSFDAARSAQMNAAIAEAIGPIVIEIEGERYEFLSGNYEDLRDRIRTRLFTTPAETAGV